MRYETFRVLVLLSIEIVALLPPRRGLQLWAAPVIWCQRCACTPLFLMKHPKAMPVMMHIKTGMDFWFFLC
jgi:hypothetical protein